MDDDSDSHSSRSASTGFAFIMLAAGFMTICTTGIAQIAALAVIFVAGTASLAALLPKDSSDLEWPGQDSAQPPPANAETPTLSQQPTLNPEKSWVALLDRSSQAGRQR